MQSDEVIISTYEETKSIQKTSKILSVPAGQIRDILRRYHVPNSKSLSLPKASNRVYIRHWYAIQHGEDYSIDYGTTHKNEAIEMARSMANNQTYNGEEIRIAVYTEDKATQESTIIYRKTGGVAFDRMRAWIDAQLLPSLIYRQRMKGYAKLSIREAEICLPYMVKKDDVYAMEWTHKKTGICYIVTLYQENNIWFVTFIK